MDVDQSRIDPDYRQSCKHNKYQLGQGPWRLLTNYLADVTNLLVSIFTIECFVRDPRQQSVDAGPRIITFEHSNYLVNISQK